MISSEQFGNTTGEMFQQHPDTPSPLSLSANTSNSASQATAWRTRGLSQGGILPLSSRTEGSIYKFEDNQTTKPSVQE